MYLDAGSKATADASERSESKRSHESHQKGFLRAEPVEKDSKLLLHVCLLLILTTSALILMSTNPAVELRLSLRGDNPCLHLFYVSLSCWPTSSSLGPWSLLLLQILSGLGLLHSRETCPVHPVN